MSLEWSVLDLDCSAERTRLASELRRITSRELHKRGLVVAISGGIDSSVCAALAVEAVGAARVLCLILPERDSDPDSATRARLLAAHLGVSTETRDIEPALRAIGCYESRDEAVRSVLPDYGPDWKMKIALRSAIDGGINRFALIAEDPEGGRHERELDLNAYLGIVAATNYKQRLRKAIEYHHADRLNYAVVGTPNRLEFDQGFFVKNGDGAADVKPLAHLYKTQVYALARHLGLPERLCSVTPSTDTYALEQGQDEFYFALPYASMDLALWALDHDVPAAELARVLKIDARRADAVYADIRRKRHSTRYLHRAPAVLSETRPRENRSTGRRCR